MAHPEGIVGVFDRAADIYDHVGVPWFGPIAAGLVAQLDVRPGERVHIGCGRGAALRPLALATGPTGRAVGIDLAPRMVELTARDLAAYPQVEVAVGDARAPASPLRRSTSSPPRWSCSSCPTLQPRSRRGPGC